MLFKVYNGMLIGLFLVGIYLGTAMLWPRTFPRPVVLPAPPNQSPVTEDCGPESAFWRHTSGKWQKDQLFWRLEMEKVECAGLG